MAELVYVLCAVASIACAMLLWAGFRRSRTPLLMWSSVCFAGFAVNNVLVLVDLVLVPEVDLAILRATIAVAAMLALIYALITQRE
jgi:hypothetical protein